MTADDRPPGEPASDSPDSAGGGSWPATQPQPQPPSWPGAPPPGPAGYYPGFGYQPPPGQPPYGSAPPGQPPPWYMSGYPGAAPWAARPPGSSPLAIAAGVGLLIFGAMLTLIGLLFAVIGAAGSEVLEEMDPTLVGMGDVAAVLVVFALIIVILGVIELVAAIGVFLHKAWARWTGVVVGVLGALIGLFIVAIALTPPADGGMAIFGLIWAATHVLAVVGLALGGAHFEPDRRR